MIIRGHIELIVNVNSIEYDLSRDIEVVHNYSKDEELQDIIDIPLIKLKAICNEQVAHEKKREMRTIINSIDKGIFYIPKDNNCFEEIKIETFDIVKLHTTDELEVINA